LKSILNSDTTWDHNKRSISSAAAGSVLLYPGISVRKVIFVFPERSGDVRHEEVLRQLTLHQQFNEMWST
jgi:hypothetical protein